MSHATDERIPSRCEPELTPVANALLTIAKLHNSQSRLVDIRTFFEDDHVHAALILQGRILLTVIERDDLAGCAQPGDTLARFLGTLEGRTVLPDAPLEATRRAMLNANRRRLAAVDPDGNFRGLLCLKRSGTGFCSDEDVSARFNAR